MEELDYKLFLNTYYGFRLSAGDVILIRSCIQYILSHSSLSEPARKYIESIDNRFKDALKDLNCGSLDLDKITIIEEA